MLIFIGLALCFFFVVAFSWVRRDFTEDEINFTLRYLEMDSPFVVIDALRKEIWCLPIYFLFMWVWAKAFGLEFFVLLLPSLIATAIGIVFLALSQRNNLMRILVVLVCVLNPILYPVCAWMIRPYAFVFMFSCIAYFCFVRKWRICFIASISLLVLSHWCCVFLVAYYLGVEAIKTPRKIIQYIMPVGLFLIWFISVVAPQVWFVGSIMAGFGVEKPTILGNIWLVWTLFSWFIILFGFGVWALCKRKEGFLPLACLAFWALVILFSIILPCSLFVLNYFAPVFPFIFLIEAIGLYKIFSLTFPKHML